MFLNIIEVRATDRIRVGVDILLPDFKEVDLIVWDWEGIYGIIPKPVIENMKEYIKTHYPLMWDNGKENHETPLVSTSKNRPKQLNFTWDQVREVEPYVAKTLMGL
jgi:hypothetical protein